MGPFKIEKTKINISSSFLARSKCVECRSYPLYYFIMYRSYGRKNARLSSETFHSLKKFIHRMNEDYYLSYQPRHFTSLSSFSFKLALKSYNPILYKSRGLPVDMDNCVTEFLTCDCGKSVWAFDMKYSQNKTEVINRKGKYHYPGTF